MSFKLLYLELINYTQPVYVWREDPNSRQNTIKEIKRRTTSPDGWQQILIFPEGTCSNRTGLITFKPGAFYPGVPVQPVLIRYPNRLDTVSWTWQGPGAYVTDFNWTNLHYLTMTRIRFQIGTTVVNYDAVSYKLRTRILTSIRSDRRRKA